MTSRPEAERVLHRFIEDMWNAHRLDTFAEHVHPDVRLHPPRGPPRDYAGYHEMAVEFLRAFPDLHFTIQQIHGDDEHASTRLLIEGTNTGPFRSHPATGHNVRVIGQPQCRVKDGKIIEFWQLFDELGMLHQLGHLADETLMGEHGEPASRH